MSVLKIVEEFLIFSLRNMFSRTFFSFRSHYYLSPSEVSFLDLSATIPNCYATGDVSSGNDSSDIGGFCGENTSTCTITRCYSTGFVSAGDNSSDIGGLCGDSTYGAVNNSYWDVNTSGQTSSYGGTDKTTTEMQMQNTFIGWDFDDDWAICEGTNYPRLQWQIPTADWLCPDGVDFLDYAHFSYYWLSEDCPDSNDCNSTDFDFSGSVDSNDLKVFTTYWLFAK